MTRRGFIGKAIGGAIGLLGLGFTNSTLGFTNSTLGFTNSTPLPKPLLATAYPSDMNMHQDVLADKIQYVVDKVWPLEDKLCIIRTKEELHKLKSLSAEVGINPDKIIFTTLGA